MTCDLCGEQAPDTEVLEHLRLMHPEQYGDGPALWPDGSVVIVDTTLEPGDFTEGQSA